LVARVDRAPDRPGAADPEHTGERRRVIRRQDGDPVPWPHPPGGQGSRDGATEVANFRIRAADTVRREAGRAGVERRALVEIVDQSHRAQPSTVTTGSRTRPKLASTPRSSRCPKAWQPDANPARCGGR